MRGVQRPMTLRCKPAHLSPPGLPIDSQRVANVRDALGDRCVIMIVLTIWHSF